MQTEAGIEFGNRLKAVLSTETLHEKSLRELAEVLGTSSVTLRKWLSGNIPYALLILSRLHKNYDIDLNYLLIGEERKQDGDKGNSN